MIGKPPKSERLLFSLDQRDWNLAISQLFQRDAGRNEEPVRTVGQTKILLLRLRLAVLAHRPVWIVAPYPVIEGGTVAGPEIRNQDSSTIAVPFLPNDFAPFKTGDAPQQRGVRDLARDPGRRQHRVVIFGDGPRLEVCERTDIRPSTACPEASARLRDRRVRRPDLGIALTPGLLPIAASGCPARRLNFGNV